MKSTTRRSIKVLKVVALTLLLSGLLLEGVLRLFDPFGFNRSLDNLNRLNADVTYAADGSYQLRPGFHPMAGWAFAVNADGDRVTPDTAASGCSLVLLGDSVTMGWSVDDAQTWANRIAQALPGLHLVNAGVVGYNVQDVYESYLRHPGADAYVYLLIGNDDQPRLSFFGARQSYPLLTLAYLNVFAWGHEPPGDARFFAAYAARLSAPPNLQVVAFAGEPLARYFPHVATIPPYTHRISRADSHADARGNQEIAQAMLPILQTMQQRFCDLRYNAGRGE